jgi:hypothetical protein
MILDEMPRFDRWNLASAPGSHPGILHSRRIGTFSSAIRFFITLPFYSVLWLRILACSLKTYRGILVRQIRSRQHASMIQGINAACKDACAMPVLRAT